MSKGPNGSYSSATCPNCYAATLINVYPGVKAKLENNAGKMPSLTDFASDIKKIKDTGTRFIRFYSLGDFGTSGDISEIEYIHTAADIMPVELFSKTLHFSYLKHLPRLASHPNVHISLSMNKSFDDAYISNVYDFLVKNKLLRNVQINYTFIGDEPMRIVPHISVYHTTKKNKLDLFNFVGYNRSCCTKDEDGNKIVSKNTGNHKGSCAKCMLCKLPAANAAGDILIPKLREALYI